MKHPVSKHSIAVLPAGLTTLYDGNIKRLRKACTRLMRNVPIDQRRGSHVVLPLRQMSDVLVIAWMTKTKKAWELGGIDLVPAGQMKMFPMLRLPA